MNLAVKESPSRQHHGAAAELEAYLSHGTDYTVTLNHQVINGLLKQPEIRLVLQNLANGCLIQNTVSLSTCGTYSGTFGAVQDTELNTALVSGQCHGTAQRINLFDQMTLANTADAGVAAHLPQGFDIVGQQQCFAAHTRSGQRSLGAGMAATDHDHIKFLWVQHVLAPGPRPALAPARSNHASALMAGRQVFTSCSALRGTRNFPTIDATMPRQGLRQVFHVKPGVCPERHIFEGKMRLPCAAMTA